MQHGRADKKLILAAHGGTQMASSMITFEEEGGFKPVELRKGFRSIGGNSSTTPLQSICSLMTVSACRCHRRSSMEVTPSSRRPQTTLIIRSCHSARHSLRFLDLGFQPSAAQSEFRVRFSGKFSPHATARGIAHSFPLRISLGYSQFLGLPR